MRQALFRIKALQEKEDNKQTAANIDLQLRFCPGRRQVHEDACQCEPNQTKRRNNPADPSRATALFNSALGGPYSFGLWSEHPSSLTMQDRRLAQINL